MSVFKVWKAGKDVLVVTIPMNMRKARDIKVGDYLEIPEITKIEPKEAESLIDPDINEEYSKKKLIFK